MGKPLLTENRHQVPVTPAMNTSSHIWAKPPINLFYGRPCWSAPRLLLSSHTFSCFFAHLNSVYMYFYKSGKSTIQIISVLKFSSYKLSKCWLLLYCILVKLLLWLSSKYYSYSIYRRSYFLPALSDISRLQWFCSFYKSLPMCLWNCRFPFASSSANNGLPLSLLQNQLKEKKWNWT